MSCFICEGSKLPEAHTEPFETHIPNLYKYKRNDSPSTNLKIIFMVLESLLVLRDLIIYKISLLIHVL